MSDDHTVYRVREGRVISTVGTFSARDSSQAMRRCLDWASKEEVGLLRRGAVDGTPDDLFLVLETDDPTRFRGPVLFRAWALPPVREAYDFKAFA